MKKNETQVEDPEMVIESAIERTESYLEKNFRALIGAVVAIIIFTGGYFSYQQFIKIPKNENASAAAFVAEQYFQADSFALALNGAEDFEGFLSIADNYSSTTVGNIANHYAGICYLKLQDFDNAIVYLQRYNAVEGDAAAIINAQNIGLVGDAYSEKGSIEESIKYYEKAAAIENNFTTPTYLKKLGIAYEILGNNAKALECYEAISIKYPTSMEGRDITKYIGRIEK